MVLHVICVAYNRIIPLRGLIDSFMVQTDPRWVLHIIHDGPALNEVKDVINLYKGEHRVRYQETPQCNGNFGHVNRKMMLEKLAGACDDFVLITNDDNYYVPAFVEYFLKASTSEVGMMYCNTVHNYIQYDVLYTRVKECFIDMGSFVVRMDVAKAVGFTQTHHSADGYYAVHCAEYCNAHRLRILYIDKPLFVHN